MKNNIYLILIVLILSCNNSKTNSQSKAALNELTCENKKELLRSKNNWKIPLDRIKNIDNYITESRIQLKTPNATKGIEKTRYGMSMYSNIFPYTKVNGIEIGLMQLVRITGGGYISSINDSFKIRINDKYKSDLNIKQKVFEFYRDFKRTKNHFNIKLTNPRVDLTFIGDNFNKLNDVLMKISLGYLKFADLQSEKNFSKKVCDLNPIELKSLKSKYKLNIRIFKDGVILKNHAKRKKAVK